MHPWKTSQKGKTLEKKNKKMRGKKTKTCGKVKQRQKAAPLRVVVLTCWELSSAPLHSSMPSPPSYDGITWTSDAEGLFKGLRSSFMSSALIKGVLGEWQACREAFILSRSMFGTVRTICNNDAPITPPAPKERYNDCSIQLCLGEMEGWMITSAPTLSPCLSGFTSTDAIYPINPGVFAWAPFCSWI